MTQHLMTKEGCQAQSLMKKWSIMNLTTMEDKAVADHRYVYVYVNSNGEEEMYYSV